MLARGGGAIINMGSGSWKINGSGYAVYATCKSAMLGLRETEIANIPLSCRA